MGKRNNTRKSEYVATLLDPQQGKAPWRGKPVTYEKQLKTWHALTAKIEEHEAVGDAEGLPGMSAMIAKSRGGHVAFDVVSENRARRSLEGAVHAGNAAATKLRKEISMVESELGKNQRRLRKAARKKREGTVTKMARKTRALRAEIARLRGKIGETVAELRAEVADHAAEVARRTRSPNIMLQNI